MAGPRLNLPFLNALDMFEATARRGSFADASEEWDVTPPAFSRMMARLKAHLHLLLMPRDPGGLRLTEDGAILHGTVSRGLATIATALQKIEEPRHGVEVVPISTGFTTHWPMPRMAHVKDRFPDAEWRFQLIMGALSGPVDDVDFGMRFRHGPDDRHDAADIMPEILVRVCPAGFAATEPLIKPAAGRGMGRADRRNAAGHADGAPALFRTVAALAGGWRCGQAASQPLQP